jgi:hypothetical protein
MQTVELNVFVVWHAVALPASHDIKTAEQADAKLSSDTRHNTLVFLLVRQGDYSRHVLKTHQHEVGAQLFTDSNSFTQTPFEDVDWHVVHRGVGSGLPDHQRRQTRHHVSAHRFAAQPNVTRPSGWIGRRLHKIRQT